MARREQERDWPRQGDIPRNPREDCKYCQAENGNAGKVIFATPDVVAFFDPNPDYEVHIKIVPRLHIVSLLDLTPEDGPVLIHLMAGVQEVSRRLDLEALGFFIRINAGPKQHTPHLHCHIMGGKSMKKLR